MDRRCCKDIRKKIVKRKGDAWIVLFKDLINPYNCLLKNASFLIKTTNEQITSYIITVVLDGLICFSARFYKNLLLVLKMRFQVFCFSSKKVQGVSSDRKIIMSLLSVHFHQQNRVSVFWNFNFYPKYLGNIYVPEIKLIS